MPPKSSTTSRTPKSSALPRWDLRVFYDSLSSPLIAKDLETLTKKIKTLATLRGGLSKLSPAEFGKAIRQYEAISELAGKLMSYSYLNYATALETPKVLQFHQAMQEKINTLYSDLVFFTLEINQLSDAQIQRLAKDRTVSNYLPWLTQIRVYRPHQLSEDLEKILLEKSITSSQSWVRLFDETMAKLRFPLGKTEVSSAVIFHQLSDSNPSVRKRAAESISQTLGANISLFTNITNVLAKDKEIEDRWRKFPLPISARNLSNFVEDDVVEALISTTKANYKHLSHRYYALKASWFKKKSLPYWDRNAPLPFDVDRTISWGEAKEIVLSAYRAFSPTIADIAARFFDERWIDAAVYSGKESGAFSHPTVPSAHPFVLMNFQGKLRDVMTLAHELGHGVHQVLSSKQGALLCDTPLTLAETASVFGEQLTFRALLAREKNPTARKAMIAHKVEDMLNTVVRQIAFCEFERKVHAARREGEVSSEQLGKFWLEVQRESLGKAITLDASYGCYWAYIPHFVHSPFYVYAYAFGDCLVNSLYRVYQESPKGFEQKYLTMLSEGGRLHHKALLKPFGLDASKKDFWQKGMDVIAEMVRELE